MRLRERPITLKAAQPATLWEAVDRMAKAADGYPPYNIERQVEDDGSEIFLISIAVAGFAQNELELLADQVLLLTKRPTRIAEILSYGDARPRTVETLSEPSFITTKKRSLEIFQREVRR